MAVVVTALTREPMLFFHLRRALNLDAATLGRVLGALAVQGRVEQAGMPARWRLTGPKDG